MAHTHDKPLVSVIIPVYNSERYLAEAIESALAQTYQPMDIIVVDDGSTDNSADIADQFASEVKVCHQSNAGISAARNRGIDLAQGSFFSFLDADDLWIENKTALQMAAFEQDSSLDMVFGQVVEFRDPDLEKAADQAPKHLGNPVPGLVPGASTIRKTSFLKVGLFSTKLQVAEWADWYLRSKECGLKSTMLPHVVLKRRLHDDNIGIRMRDSQVQYVRVLKAALDRRRQSAQPDSTQTGAEKEIGLDHE